MGSFDTLIINCPECGQEVEYQSKCFKCQLKKYTIYNAPLCILGDLADYDEAVYCQGCGAGLTLDVQRIVEVHVSR